MTHWINFIASGLRRGVVSTGTYWILDYAGLVYLYGLTNCCEGNICSNLVRASVT